MEDTLGQAASLFAFFRHFSLRNIGTRQKSLAEEGWSCDT